MSISTVVKLSTSQASYFPLEEVEVKLEFITCTSVGIEEYAGFKSRIPEVFYPESRKKSASVEAICYYTTNPGLGRGEVKLNQMQICFYGLLSANPSWINIEDSKISYSHVPKRNNSKLLVCSMPKNLVINKTIEKSKKMVFFVRFALPGPDYLPPTFIGANFRIKYGISLEFELTPHGESKVQKKFQVPIVVDNPFSSFRKILTSGRIFSLKYQFSSQVKKPSLFRKIYENPKFQIIDSEIRSLVESDIGTKNYSICFKNQQIGKVIIPRTSYRLGEDIQVVFQKIEKFENINNNNNSPKIKAEEEEEEEIEGEGEKEIEVEKKFEFKCVGVKCSLVCCEKIVKSETLRIDPVKFNEDISRKIVYTERKVQLEGIKNLGFSFKINCLETYDFSTDVFQNSWILVFNFWIDNLLTKKREELKWNLPIHVYPQDFNNSVNTKISKNEFLIV